MKTIYLIGFMGSGKSTIGSILSGKLNKSFVDTDLLIEHIYQQKIRNIFKHQGEATFREYESKALQIASEKDIVATGGGIVEKEENIQFMKKTGHIIYLQTTFEEIKNRLQFDEARPLWQTDDEQQQRLFQKRIHLYENCADLSIDTTDKTVEDIVQEVIEKYNF